MHKYGKESLSTKSRNDWWYVPIKVNKIKKEELPLLIQNNKFIEKTLTYEEKWHLKLPKNTKLFVFKYKKRLLLENKTSMVWLYDYSSSIISLR